MKPLFRSIQFALAVVMSTVALLAMVTVAFLVYNKFTDNMRESLMTNTAQVVSQAANTLNVYVQDMISVSDSIIGDINTYNSSVDKLREVLSTTRRVKQDIAAVTIINSRGRFIAYAPTDYVVKEEADVLLQDWFPEQQLSDSDYYFAPPHVQNIYEGQYPWVVTLCRNITMHDIGNTAYNLTLIMDMNFSSIEQYCSELRIGRRGYVFILDEDNTIVYHPQQHVIYLGLKTEELDFFHDKESGTYLFGDNRVYSVEPIVHTNWKLVGVSYMEDYQLMLRETLSYLAMVFGVVLIFVLIFSLLASQFLSRPIKRLAGRMEHVERESFTDAALVPVRGFDEVCRLSVSFNKMTYRIRELMEQVKREEQELNKSELRALQAQINPHFLYNTLDSILWMCEQGDGPRAVTMVSALSRLFRISISKGAEIITIREELMHAESYLTIQQIRYKDQFDYKIEADESLLDYNCLKIILQPLLENAIYHGIDRMVDKGLLIIRVIDKGDRILLQVEDNGLGIEPEMLEAIWSAPKDKQRKHGIGVVNVNNRIRIYFGREYGIKLDSVPDEGTTVSVWIPKTKGEVEL